MTTCPMSYGMAASIEPSDDTLREKWMSNSAREVVVAARFVVVQLSQATYLKIFDSARILGIDRGHLLDFLLMQNRLSTSAYWV